MKEKYIKNLPSTCTSLFLIILLYCTRFLSKKSKKGWTIAYIVFAIIELIIAIIL